MNSNGETISTVMNMVTNLPSGRFLIVKVQNIDNKENIEQWVADELSDIDIGYLLTNYDEGINKRDTGFGPDDR